MNVIYRSRRWRCPSRCRWISGAHRRRVRARRPDEGPGRGAVPGGPSVGQPNGSPVSRVRVGGSRSAQRWPHHEGDAEGREGAARDPRRAARRNAAGTGRAAPACDSARREHLDDGPGARAARLHSKKKTLVATEQGAPHIQRLRDRFRARARTLDPSRLIFIDEAGSHIAMTRDYARAPRTARRACARTRSAQPRHRHDNDRRDGPRGRSRHDDRRGRDRRRGLRELRRAHPCAEAEGRRHRLLRTPQGSRSAPRSGRSRSPGRSPR
jgi:hypothetical protein